MFRGQPSLPGFMSLILPNCHQSFFHFRTINVGTENRAYHHHIIKYDILLSFGHRFAKFPIHEPEVSSIRIELFDSHKHRFHVARNIIQVIYQVVYHIRAPLYMTSSSPTPSILALQSKTTTKILPGFLAMYHAIMR